MDTMYEQKHETKLEQDSNQENVTIHETEQFTVQKNETESVQENNQFQELIIETEISHGNNQNIVHDTDLIPKAKSILEKYSEKKPKRICIQGKLI